MRHFFHRRGALAALFAILAAGFLSLPAHAGDPEIDAAKATGLVGERIDGYLDFVRSGASPALRRKVTEVNNKRRALYSKLANDTGVTVAQVARVTGQKQIDGAPSGHYYMDEGGGWKRK